MKNAHLKQGQVSERRVHEASSLRLTHSFEMGTWGGVRNIRELSILNYLSHINTLALIRPIRPKQMLGWYIFDLCLYLTCNCVCI